MKSILLAFAMFSRIPLPRLELREENMRYVMAAFPLVGVVVGGVAVAWGFFCDWLGLGGILRGAGFALLPAAASGGIHLDGFCDTMDALASHGGREMKQRILRDPHTGAFAVIGVCCYLIAFAALGAESNFSGKTLLCFGLAFVLSRSLAGMAVLAVPASEASNLVRSFHDAAAIRYSLAALGCGLAGLGLLMSVSGGAAGSVAFFLSVVMAFWWMRRVRREFGGMSGDLAGCFLQMSELLSLAVLVLAPKILAAL